MNQSVPSYIRIDGQEPDVNGASASTTQDVAARMGIEVAGHHLVDAVADPRALDVLARHIERSTQDVVLPPQLEFPSATSGLQREGAARARQLAEFAKHTVTIIKLCQVNIKEEDLRSRIETIAVKQLAALQSARTDIAFAYCLPDAQRRLVATAAGNRIVHRRRQATLRNLRRSPSRRCPS